MSADLRAEITGGVTTFLTMSYIVVVNPSILATPGTGLRFEAVMTATVLLCVTMTALMGLYAKLPFAVAPGMGLNAFFTYHVVLAKQVPAPVALGLVAWAGAAFLLVSGTPLRSAVARAVPTHLRHAAAAGIGIFLAFIALKAAGVVAQSPATFVTAGHFGKASAVFAVGLLISVPMLLYKRAAALLAGIIGATMFAIAMGEAQLPASVVAPPDFSLLFAADLRASLAFVYLPIFLAIVLTDLFDSLSTFVGVATATGLTDAHGEPKNLGRGLVVDALATLVAGLVGTSAGTAYVESAAGIRAGGRTGLAAIVCALCFVPLFFFGPIARVVPSAATAPALFLVGVLMFAVARSLPVDRLEEALPAFATLVCIPLTFSIGRGMLTGYVLHVGCFVIAGRRRELSMGAWILGVVCVGALVIEELA